VSKLSTDTEEETMDELITCLWFDTEGEEAAQFYTSLFPNSRVLDVTHYGSAGPRPVGMVMTVTFELDGRRFVALNGGPEYSFTPAVSFQVMCESQAEIDRYWEALSECGEPGPCGWVQDRFGVSWQVVPTALPQLLSEADAERAQRVMAAMLSMSKLEIEPLELAAA
jgi:predicted 3-demethylubiquinone-9 3-methyltransferase (glyoxalase superfamily)